MIDYALCLAIQSSQAFQSNSSMSVNDVYNNVAESGNYARPTVLHTLIAAALDVCQNPDGLYSQRCLSVDKPTPGRVPTHPDSNQRKALRQYLASPVVDFCQ